MNAYLCDNCSAPLPAHHDTYIDLEACRGCGRAIETKLICQNCGAENIRFTVHGEPKEK